MAEAGVGGALMKHRFDEETYRAVQSDGLLDMVLGGLIVVWFLVEVGEVVGGLMAWVPLVLLFGLVGGLIYVRRTITYPRVGIPGDARSMLIRRILAGGAVILGLAITLTTIFVTVQLAEGSEGLWAAISIALGAVVTFGLLATILRLPRLWLYAAIYGSPFLLWALLETAGVDNDPFIFLVLAVLTSVGLGIWRLRRFLREHPRSPARPHTA